MKQSLLINNFLDQSKDLIWMIDLDFKLIYANKEYLNFMKEMTGKEKKLNDSAFVEAFGKKDTEKWQAYYERALTEGYFEIEEHFYNEKSNEIQYNQITFIPITDEDHKITAVSCQSKDITFLAKQRSEANQLMDASLDVFCTIDEAGNFVHVSAASVRLWGYQPQELIGVPYMSFVLEEDVPKTKMIAEAIINGQEVRTFSNRYLKKDGSVAYNFWSVRWDDNLKLMFCVARDGREKIKQEEKLLQSEKRFKALVQGGSDLYAIIDLEGRYTYMSPSSSAIIGIPPEEFIGRDAFEFIHPDDYEQTLASLHKIAAEEKVVMAPYRAKNHKNEWRWVETVLTNMIDNPAVNGIVINSSDITEKVIREEKILQSEQRFKALVQEGSDLIAILDSEANYSYVSPTSISVLGMAPEEFIGRNALEFIHPDDLEKSKRSLQLIAVEKKVLLEPFRFQIHENEWRWIETVLTNMLDNPTVKGIVANSRDVTDKIKEEQKLRILESVATNTEDAVLITEAEPQDPPGPKIIFVNEAFTKMTGYQPEEVLGKTPRILQGPKSNREDLLKLGHSLRNWEPDELTTINYRKNGEEFWINFTVTPVADEKGNYTHWIAIERDVTEQKVKEIEKELIHTISDIFHQTIDNDLTECLTNLCKHITKFGDFDFAEMWLPAIDAKTINRVTTYVEGKSGNVFYKATKQIKSCELGKGMPGYIWEHKKMEIWENVEGEWLASRKAAAVKAGIVAMMGVPIKDKEEVIGVLLLGTEKTKSALASYSELLQKLETTIGIELSRKKIEIELAQIFDFTPDMICMSGFDGYIKRINPAGLELLGYSLEELRTKPIKSFVYKEDRLRTSEQQKSLYAGKDLKSFENRYITKKGEIVWLSWTATASPEHGVVYAVAKNITEEKKLRVLNRQAGSLAKIGSWEISVTNKTIYWSEEVHQLHETDPDSFLPSIENSKNFYRKDFQQSVEEMIRKCVATGEPFDFEAVIVTAKKKEIWVRVIGDAEFVDGECRRVYGSFQDIDDRKQAEIRLQALAENLPGVVFQYHIYPDGSDSLNHVTKGAKNIWGFTAEEVVENNQLVWDRINAGGELEKVKKNISDSIEFKTKWYSSFKYIMPSGELRTHLGSGTPSFLADGTVLFNSIILDITQEAKNEELLTQASEMARIGSWELDLINQDQKSMYWSPMMKEMLEVDENYSPNLNTCLELYIDESKDRVEQAMNLLIKDDVAFDEELLLRTAKGNELWIRCIGKSEIVNNQRTKVYGSFQDIHDRKIAVLELERSLKSLKDYKFSLDQSAIIAFTDKKGVITSVNDNFCKISQYDRNEIIGKTHRLINSNYHSKEFFKDLWRTIASGSVWRGEVKNKTKSGTYYWVDTTIVPFLDDKNNPVQYLAIRFDITLRKLAEEEKNTLQRTLENSLNEIYIFDAETFYFTYVNKGALLNLGYSEEEIKTITPLDIKPDYTIATFKKLIKPLTANEQKKIIFFTNHKRKDGSLYPVEVHLQLVAESSKNRFLAIILDITERKKAEEKVLLANERFEKVTEATNDAIWDWDIVNQTFYRSKAIETFFGVSALKSMDEKEFWKDKFHPEDLAEIQKSLSEALNNPSTNRWEVEYRVINEDEKTLYVIDRGVIIRDHKGKPIRMVGSMTDISEQKHLTVQLSKMNEELKQHAADLERSNEELEQFAFVASHDLQEPLRMISSFMDLLQRRYGDELDEKGLQYIHFATDGAKRMKQIILDLLDYSRAARPTEGKEKVDLTEVISEFKQLRRKLISEKNAIIKSKNLPIINTYKAAITQIFHCILDNALKYVEADKKPLIEIHVVEHETEWQFSIQDNGIGIDPEFYDKIFIIFQRLHNKDQFTGTGIGLSIAKRHVEFLGGTIWVESLLGEGTTFYFTISKTK